MVLDSDAQDPEAMIPYCIALDSRFIFEDVVDWLREEANKGVTLGGRHKYTAQLKPQYLAHAVESCL